MSVPAPMLATLGTAGDIDERGNDWAFEMKWDGIRAIAHVHDGRVRLWTRNGNEVTGTYPELAALAERTGGDATLDGEIVALNRQGRPDFGRLQQRMGLTRASEVRAAQREVPVNYMVFDILSAGGKSTVGLEYPRRRALLETAVRSGDGVQVPPAFDGDLDAAMASSRALGLEGVVAKRGDSEYAAGKRSRAWIKIKHHLAQEVLVGGWRPGNGRREAGIGSLLLGIPSDDGLHYVGRVGTGFSDRDLVAIGRRLTTLARPDSPFVDIPSADSRDAVWVEPTLVAEVEFAEWTSAERLRQPSWRGWRPDKSPTEVVREG